MPKFFVRIEIYFCKKEFYFLQFIMKATHLLLEIATFANKSSFIFNLKFYKFIETIKKMLMKNHNKRRMPTKMIIDINSTRKLKIYIY